MVQFMRILRANLHQFCTQWSQKRHILYKRTEALQSQEQARLVTHSRLDNLTSSIGADLKVSPADPDPLPHFPHALPLQGMAEFC